ncbi:histone acetyltransferase [Theileria orientalis strain Shintoku]|uniref:histone acetyltransferase n=1 Tax=Theileria orientalis strain Shintoku TaxID=869250 RepID=J4CCE4_THEOR|nr:histone acetyltransferase [Theileria orientalis strain Shintoku]BAM39247.1 histone acetyltransferase [Theileria orientalis strain Shintoku]|eukprot:XP_009689548.1 histone acetyltransferase [Theileria orientalis strain Shintoku]
MKASHQSEHEGFAKIRSFKIKHVEVSEYMSVVTGVHVFFMRYETPLVNTYLLVPTREETDEGLPHTLEHLIFLGSKKYPFRGTLDLVSCKSLSSGTNAWTSVDHTAYTLSTAGLEGTLQMLPIFLDHILRPSLTEIGFMTDIHHVTSDGSSSGVAYCEMKSRENHPDEMMSFEALDKLYPGDSGYKRNTGGKLSGLRSTNIHRVRAFHKKFYNWSNLSIVLCGNVNDCESVLALVHDLEKSMDLGEGSNSVRSPKRKKTNIKADLESLYKGRTRVWDDPKHVEKLERSSRSTLYFPCEEEESGTFSVSWRGPRWDEFELARSVSIMGSYLVDSTASPLEKALIHTSDPCGSCVDFSIELLKESYFQLVIKDVPVKGKEVGSSKNNSNSSRGAKGGSNVSSGGKEEDSEGEEEEEGSEDGLSDSEKGDEGFSDREKDEEGSGGKESKVEGEKDKMEEVEERLRSELSKVYENKLDMERMRMLIRRGHYNYLRQIETCAHETLIDNLIGYVIYGERPEQLEQIIVDYEIVESLLEKDEDYWKKILHRYFIEPPSVSVKCIPSVERAKEIQEEERKLMENQIKKYGIDQLKKNKALVEEDLKKNKGGPPKEIVKQYSQCDSRKIELPTYPLYRNFKHTKNVSDDGTGTPKSFSDGAGSGTKKIESGEHGTSDTGSKRRRREELERFRSQLERVKYPIQVNNIPTDFVRIYMVFSTCKLELTEEEKKLLFMLCVLLFESNVYFGDKLVRSEEFISTLMENTTSYGCNLGLSSSALLPDAYSELLTLYFTCAADNYSKLLEILHNVLHRIKYDRTILTKHAKSLLNSFSKKKRSPKTMMKQLNNYLKVDSKSIRHLCSLGQQDKLLKETMSDTKGPGDLEDKLNKLHRKVFNVENMSVHLTADLDKLKGDWPQFWVDLGYEGKVDSSNVKGQPSTTKAERSDSQVLREYLGFEYGRDRQLKESTGYLSSLASTDVSHMCVSIPAPYGYNHPEYFTILTSCEYLTMTEGPLYRAIRGGGYAYHHRVSYLASQGEIQFVITEATDLINALRVTKESILKCLDPNVDIDQEMLAAKSSLIYRILSNEESLADYSQETYTNALRETDVDFNKHSAVQVKGRCTAILDSGTGKREDQRSVCEVLQATAGFRGSPEDAGVHRPESRSKKRLNTHTSLKQAENISNGFKTAQKGAEEPRVPEMVTKQVQYKDEHSDKTNHASSQKNNAESHALSIQKAREKSAILAKAREMFSQQFPTAYPMDYELWGKDVRNNSWRRCCVVHARYVVSKAEAFRPLDQSRQIESLNPHEYDYYIHWLGLDRRLDCWLSMESLRTLEQGPPKGAHVIHEVEQEFHHEHADDEYLREHEINTKLKTINRIKLGPYLVDTWYFSPYPEPFQNIDTLFICEFCLSFFRADEELSFHTTQCELRHPPGNEIYRDENLAMFEVDGAMSTVYCENLCFLSKLFLDHKSLRHTVVLFIFYIMTEFDENGYHITGYFSKEKHSKNNVSCILSLPQHQRKGYGKYLTAFSYLLSKKEGKTGTPERPLSDLGKASYMSYWSEVLLEILFDPKYESLSIQDLSQMTAFEPNDIISCLEELGLLHTLSNGSSVITILPEKKRELMSKSRTKTRKLYMDKLHWIPYDAHNELTPV